MRPYLPSVADANRMTEFPAAATPAGTIMVRAAGLRVQGMTVTAVNAVPSAGEPAVFCRPAVTAPASVRRDGMVLAAAWLPDLVRLGELEAYLGNGVIEAAVDAAVAEGRLKPRQLAGGVRGWRRTAPGGRARRFRAGIRRHRCRRRI